MIATAALAVPLGGLLLGPQAYAQGAASRVSADRECVGRSAAGPTELSQYDFLVGDWDVTVTMPRSGGQPLVYQATWRNCWIANGYVLMQEWRDPYSTGIELRSFNPETRTWDGHNLYVPTPGAWYVNESVRAGDNMVVTTQSRAPDGAPIVKREIYFAIETRRFEIRTEVSLDGAITWRPGGYRLVATRRSPS
ncbi:hypothetical protein GEMMAAP_18870 [Gemmatimonas phototrophica]|uniref:DUF1579 domain-containing protein n=2 Tax=Gemmatimonas phototrophica TaxID=1379270 RepID=A0A143BMH8_9BACT|nr:hypothetical protein GEMMAAP_18870 [Gemmatimonas phototrophica]